MRRADGGVGVDPLVAEQFRGIEGLQRREMLLPVGDEQGADDAARQAVCPFADGRDVSRQLAVAQRRRKVEAVDLAKRRTGTGRLLQELEALAEIG